MDFLNIPQNLNLTEQGKTTLLEAKKALEIHIPDRAARLLQKANIKDDKAELAKSLMLATTLVHCNLPVKGLDLIRETIEKHPMNEEQRLYCRLLEAELLLEVYQPEAAIKVLANAPEIAAGLGRKDLAAESMIIFGASKTSLGHPDEGLVHLRQALQVAGQVQQPLLITRALAEMSANSFQQGFLERSLEEATSALESSEDIDSMSRAIAFRQRGIAFLGMQRFYEALHAHREALNIYNQLCFVPGQIKEHLNIADSYLEMGDIALAEHFVHNASRLSEEGDNPALSAGVAGVRGTIARYCGKFEDSVRFHARQIELVSNLSLPTLRADAEHKMGLSLLLREHFKEAAEMLINSVRNYISVKHFQSAHTAALDLRYAVPLLPPSAKRRANEILSSEELLGAYSSGEDNILKFRERLTEGIKTALSDDWESGSATIDQAIEMLTRTGNHLRAALELYQSGAIALNSNVPTVAGNWLTRALRIADVNGYQELGRTILKKISSIKHRGELLVLEYSLDKAALRDLSSEPWTEKKGDGQGGIIGQSPQMLKMLEEVDNFAPTDMPVLILGETGSGKELVARRIHEKSDRSSGPFVVVNCGAIPRELVESELFGSVKGAFSGAVANRPGLIEQAHGGTLFLDELGELPIESQPKLLRFLQEGEVRRVGGTQTSKVDVRVLSATHQNLYQAVEQGRLREDIYYRIRVCWVSIPPLREREFDIILIAREVIRTLPYAKQKGLTGLSRAAESALLGYTWPGNVRELINVIKAAAVRAKQEIITENDLLFDKWPAGNVPNMIAREPSFSVPVVGKEEAMFDNVVRALKQSDGNQTKAAELLGIHRNTLRNWIQRMKKQGLL